MKKMQSAVWLVLLFLITGVPAARASEVYLSVAASLKETLDQIADSYTKKHPEVRFIKNYGGSGALAKQLENGAPVDLFISANVPWVTYLEQKRLLVGTSVTDFTTNTLVVVGRPELKINSMKDLLKLDRIAIGSPRSVPAGEYAVEALKHAFLLKQLENKLVMGRDVRQCLAYAERGEVDGAIVYRTDALLAKNSKVLFTIPPNLYERVLYPMGLTRGGFQKREAQEFYRYLQGPEAKLVLARYGFPEVAPAPRRK